MKSTSKQRKKKKINNYKNLIGRSRPVRRSWGISGRGPVSRGGTVAVLRACQDGGGEGEENNNL